MHERFKQNINYMNYYYLFLFLFFYFLFIYLFIYLFFFLFFFFFFFFFVSSFIARWHEHKVKNNFLIIQQPEAFKYYTE